MSDCELRTRALEMAVEVCGQTDFKWVLEAARQFYRFLSNEQNDGFDEYLMRRKETT